MCGRKWKRVVIVGRLKRAFCFSRYTPVITISLVSKQVRRIDLNYSLSLSSPPLFGTVLVSTLILFRLKGAELAGERTA